VLDQGWINDLQVFFVAFQDLDFDLEITPRRELYDHIDVSLGVYLLGKIVDHRLSPGSRYMGRDLINTVHDVQAFYRLVDICNIGFKRWV
jgi:hypothetical protein